MLTASTILESFAITAWKYFVASENFDVNGDKCLNNVVEKHVTDAQVIHSVKVLWEVLHNWQQNHPRPFELQLVRKQMWKRTFLIAICKIAMLFQTSGRVSSACAFSAVCQRHLRSFNELRLHFFWRKAIRFRKGGHCALIHFALPRQALTGQMNACVTWFRALASNFLPSKSTRTLPRAFSNSSNAFELRTISGCRPW